MASHTLIWKLSIIQTDLPAPLVLGGMLLGEEKMLVFIWWDVMRCTRLIWSETAELKYLMWVPDHHRGTDSSSQDWAENSDYISMFSTDWRTVVQVNNENKTRKRHFQPDQSSGPTEVDNLSCLLPVLNQRNLMKNDIEWKIFHSAWDLLKLKQRVINMLNC